MSSSAHLLSAEIQECGFSKSDLFAPEMAMGVKSRSSRLKSDGGSGRGME